MPRFVILRHEVGDALDRTDQSHFDWMFESESVLKTWTTRPVVPETITLAVTADLIADHRLAYLDFEGDIGRGRGTVTRVVDGLYQLIERTADRFIAELSWMDANQQTHQRRLLIERLREVESAGSWRLRFSG